MKYLVTDDSKLARLSMVKAIKTFQEDAEIFQAENGQVALDLLKSEQPSVVFLDLTMPVMDGYEAIPKMLEIDPHVKIVVVSADIQTQAKEKVIELGAQLHVQKPIKPEMVEEILGLI